MRLVRNRPDHAPLPPPEGTSVAIGNFDGLHLGHRALVERAAQARQGGELLAVVSFEPLPQAFFRPQAAPARLSTVRQKLQRLQAWNVDWLWLLRFDQLLAELSPAQFVRQVLVEGLAARQVVVGEDFRFGHRRAGDVSLLSQLGDEHGFRVHAVGAVCHQQQRISSTAIRVALGSGDFRQARQLLGRAFRMEGRVVRGEQLGRTLGYPTANLRIRARPCPVGGIVAAWAREEPGPGADKAIEGWRPAVCSLGSRPTVGGVEPLLEVHLFDFGRDLYGRRLEVEFVAKLRDEARFDNVQQLVAQMRLDEQRARAVLEKSTPPEVDG